MDIQHTTEFTYQVQADDEDDAEAKAKELYRNGETPDHEEVVSDGTTTNITEI